MASPINRTEKLLKVAVSALIAYFVAGWVASYIFDALTLEKHDLLASADGLSVLLVSEVITFAFILWILYRFVFSRL